MNTSTLAHSPARADGSTFLRRALSLDATATGAMGLLAVPLARQLEAPLGLPAVFLQGAGAVCLAFAALLVVIATRRVIAPALVWLVIGLNTVWALDSIAILLLGWVQPSALGEAVIVAQAVAVAGLIELEYLGLRRLQR
jgi:hypothetical protein